MSISIESTLRHQGEIDLKVVELRLDPHSPYNLSMDTTSLIPILGMAAFGLLIIVTLGIAYLTLSGWRDRQRRENDRRTNR